MPPTQIQSDGVGPYNGQLSSGNSKGSQYTTGPNHFRTIWVDLDDCILDAGCSSPLPGGLTPTALGDSAGFRVQVTDAGRAEPYRFGLTALAAIADHPEFSWLRDGDALTWLLGSSAVGRAFEAGKTVDEILALDRAAHAAWRRDRAASLLY